MQFTTKDSYNISKLEAECNRSKKLIVSPLTQRGLVWPLSMKQALIKTMFLHTRVPGVIIERDFGHTLPRELLDGQQRVSTILDFMADGFSVDLRKLATGGALTGTYKKATKYSELSLEDRENFKSFDILFYRFIFNTDREALDYFIDINTKGKRVTGFDIFVAHRGAKPHIKLLLDHAKINSLYENMSDNGNHKLFTHMYCFYVDIFKEPCATYTAIMLMPECEETLLKIAEITDRLSKAIDLVFSLIDKPKTMRAPLLQAIAYIAQEDMDMINKVKLRISLENLINFTLSLEYSSRRTYAAARKVLELFKDLY